MAEYIEVDQMWKCETCFHNQSLGCTLGMFGCDHGESYRPAYNKLKKADVAPVEYGVWLNIEYNPFWKCMIATCSNCKVRGEVRFRGNDCGFVVPDSPRCPYCGAKMDGGNNDEH